MNVLNKEEIKKINSEDFKEIKAFLIDKFDEKGYINVMEFLDRNIKQFTNDMNKRVILFQIAKYKFFSLYVEEIDDIFNVFNNEKYKQLMLWFNKNLEIGMKRYMCYEILHQYFLFVQSKGDEIKEDNVIRVLEEMYNQNKF